MTYFNQFHKEASERKMRNIEVSKQLKQVLMCLSICFFLWGCFPWSKAFKEKDVIARFGLDDTGISSLLDIDGYYLSNDTTLDGIAFYKDGTIKKIDVNHHVRWFRPLGQTLQCATLCECTRSHRDFLQRDSIVWHPPCYLSNQRAQENETTETRTLD